MEIVQRETCYRPSRCVEKGKTVDQHKVLGMSREQGRPKGRRKMCQATATVLLRSLPLPCRRQAKVYHWPIAETLLRDQSLRDCTKSVRKQGWGAACWRLWGSWRSNLGRLWGWTLWESPGPAVHFSRNEGIVADHWLVWRGGDKLGENAREQVRTLSILHADRELDKGFRLEPVAFH